jgi:hypothetical protein
MKSILVLVMLVLAAGAAAAVTLDESFGAAVFPPEMWTVHNADAGGRAWLRNMTKIRTAPGCASVTSESRTLRNDDWLVTRRLMPLPGASELEFWCRAHNTAKAESLELWVSTGGPRPEDFAYLLDGFSTSSASYERRTVSLAGFNSQPVYVAFRCRSLGQRTLYLDDVAGIGYVPADVGVAAIVAPRAYEPPDTTLVPAARVRNHGAAAQSGFGVEFAVIEVASGDTVFQGSATVGTIEPQEDVVVAATTGWTTALGEYRVVARTTLAGDMEPRNDEGSRECQVIAGEVHDAAVNVILAPVGVIGPEPVTPRVEVENLGNVAELCPVVFNVRDGGGLVYTDTVLADLPARSVQELEFADWSAAPGLYALEALTLLPGDFNPHNDTQVGAVEVLALAHDVGVLALLAPVDTIAEGDSVIPAAVVANYGDYAETFTTRMLIGGGYSDTVRLTLAAGATDTARFRCWDAVEPGRLAVTAFTMLAGDDDRSNDTAAAEVFVDPIQGVTAGAGSLFAAGVRALTGGPVVVRYSAPAGSSVRLAVFAADGRLVASREALAGPGPGEIAWDRTDAEGRRAAAGVYLLRLDTIHGRQSAKVLLP